MKVGFAGFLQLLTTRSEWTSSNFFSSHDHVHLLAHALSISLTRAAPFVMMSAQDILQTDTLHRYDNTKVFPKHPIQNGGSLVSRAHVSHEIFRRDRISSDFCRLLLKCTRGLIIFRGNAISFFAEICDFAEIWEYWISDN